MTLDTKRLRGLALAATPGPWRVSMTGYSVKSQDIDVPIIAAVPAGAQARGIDIERWLPNADLICAARDAMPALLDRIEELEATATRIEGERAVMNAIARKTALSELLIELLIEACGYAEQQDGRDETIARIGAIRAAAGIGEG